MSLFNTIKFVTEHPLNQNRKPNAVWDFVKWQIASRLAKGEIVFHWINGSKFLVKTGETGLTGNIYTGLHEFSDMGFLLHFLRSEDIFVDVGANVGSYTILASSVVGATCFAFEPVPTTFNRLTQNIKINNTEEKVKSFNWGIGEEQAKICFTSDSDTTNHVVADNEKCDNIVKIDIKTLDFCLAKEPPTMIKIDVEGYETPVLKGAKNTLKNKKLCAVIMELNGSGERYGYDEDLLLQLMLNEGFKSYSYDPLKRKLLDLNGAKTNSGNTIFIRDRSFVEKRIRDASLISINGVDF